MRMEERMSERATEREKERGRDCRWVSLTTRILLQLFVFHGSGRWVVPKFPEKLGCARWYEYVLSRVNFYVSPMIRRRCTIVRDFFFFFPIHFAFHRDNRRSNVPCNPRLATGTLYGTDSYFFLYAFSTCRRITRFPFLVRIYLDARMRATRS